MPRINALLECIGLAVCEKAGRQLARDARFGDVLLDVAKATLEYAKKSLAADDLAQAFGQIASLTRDAMKERLDPLLDGLARVHALPFRAELREYLALLPSCARRFLTRPSDPTGKTVPDAVQIQKPEDLLLFLPPRLPHLRTTPEGLEGWQLVEPLAFGEADETWRATDPSQTGAVAALTFVTDAEARKAVADQRKLYLDVFNLANVSGVLPLRSVYLETDPPAFDSPHLSGYDLASLMWDWKWKYDTAKPDAALKLMKRVCDIVAGAHAVGIVHRDLKPSNIRLHPTEGGKFTVWVAQYGWGQTAAIRSLMLSRGTTPRPEQLRLALRGAHTVLYAAPQVAKKEPPTPRDDVYSLGVVWYQLLRRAPHAPAPIDTDWAEELAAAGVTDSQARLISACLSTRPDKRPESAAHLAELLAEVVVAPPAGTDGSKLMPIKAQSADPPTGWDMMPLSATAGSSSGAKAAGPVSGGTRGSRPGLAAAVGSTGPGYGGLPKMVTNSYQISFALIPPGTFEMGSDPEEPGRREHEGPKHTVTISRPFYLGVFPVTQEQYERVTGMNPAVFHKGKGGGPAHPVEHVPWEEAMEFCKRLTATNEEKKQGRAYRLPTEAEWEYACRAGTTTPYWCGDKFTPDHGHYAAAGKAGLTAPVGLHPANPWGVCDTHGNVQEWCADWYDEYYYFDCPARDPQGPAQGMLRSVRGGCWSSFGTDCRSAARRGHDPASPGNTVGFRVVLVAG